MSNEIYDALNLLANAVWAVATKSGFHDEDMPNDMAMFCANIHGEVSELWEAHRKGQLNDPCDKADKMVAAGLAHLTCIEEELADILIRVLDVACNENVDIGRAVLIKNAFNKTRPFRHGGKLS